MALGVVRDSVCCSVQLARAHRTLTLAGQRAGSVWLPRSRWSRFAAELAGIYSDSQWEHRTWRHAHGRQGCAECAGRMGQDVWQLALISSEEMVSVNQRVCAGQGVSTTTTSRQEPNWQFSKRECRQKKGRKEWRNENKQCGDRQNWLIGLVLWSVDIHGPWTLLYEEAKLGCGSAFSMHGSV